jgi:hypothetical protein
MITLTPEQRQGIAQRFHELSTEWKAATRYRSNTRALRNHPVYQELVSLGEPVVPLILAELEREPNVSWFTVLTGITGEDPVPTAAAGRVDEMARAWLAWGRQRGYAV